MSGVRAAGIPPLPRQNAEYTCERTFTGVYEMVTWWLPGKSLGWLAVFINGMEISYLSHRRLGRRLNVAA